MGRKTFLGILDKTMAKSFPERSQETTSSGDEGVSIPEKEEPETVGSHTESELPVRCLSGDCEYVSYKNVNGVTALWCSKTKETVYNMKSCPFEKWYKDEKGWPHNIKSDESNKRGRHD